MVIAVAEGNSFNAGIFAESSYSNGMLPKHYKASDPHAELVTLMGGSRDFKGYPCTAEALQWQPNVLDIPQGGRLQYVKPIGGPGNGSLTGFLEHLDTNNGHYLAMEGLFRKTWANNDQTGMSGDVTVGTGGAAKDMTLTGTGYTVLTPNTYVKVTQSGQASNTGVGMVVSSSATALTIRMKDTPTAGTGVTWDIVQRLLTDGNEEKSYTIEKGFGDVSEYLVYPGCAVVGGSFQLNARSFIQLVTNWVSNKAIAPKATTISTNSTAYNSGVSVPPFETATNIEGFWENGTYDPNWLIQSVTVAISMPGSGDRDGLGYPGNAGHKYGSFDIEVQIQGAFSYAKLYKDLINGDPTQFAFEALDDNSNGFVLAVPKAMPISGTPTQGDNQSDSNHPVTLKGYLDSGQTVTPLSAALCYFPAA